MQGPEDDHQLGLAAVGLWHRLATAGEPVGPLELLTMAGDTTTWNPRGALDDIEPPLDELLATGWVVERGEQYVAARPDVPSGVRSRRRSATHRRRPGRMPCPGGQSPPPPPPPSPPPSSPPSPQPPPSPPLSP